MALPSWISIQRRVEAREIRVGHPLPTPNKLFKGKFRYCGCLNCRIHLIFFQEEEEHEEGHESDSDDEETVLYNPKNLPLGWDGKVLPPFVLRFSIPTRGGGTHTSLLYTFKGLWPA